MPIEINPNRINSTGNAAGRRDRQPAAENQTPAAAPKRAHVNFIPSPESLATMIRGAVAALKRGARWDRGAIVNLLV